MDKRQQYRIQHRLKLESYVALAGMTINRKGNGAIEGILYDFSDEDKLIEERRKLPRPCRLNQFIGRGNGD